MKNNHHLQETTIVAPTCKKNKKSKLPLNNSDKLLLSLFFVVVLCYSKRSSHVVRLLSCWIQPRVAPGSRLLLQRISAGDPICWMIFLDPQLENVGHLGVEHILTKIKTIKLITKQEQNMKCLVFKHPTFQAVPCSLTPTFLLALNQSWGQISNCSIVMGVPQNGWFIEKIPSRNGWWIGVPPFQETSFNFGIFHGQIPLLTNWRAFDVEPKSRFPSTWDHDLSTTETWMVDHSNGDVSMWA